MTSTTGTGAPTPAQACASYAQAICARVATCTPFSVSVTWGDTATCAKEIAAGCTGDLGTDGITATASSLSACATAISSLDCKSFASGALPADCAPIATGSRANGASCAGANQCMSGFCQPPAMPGCGQCATPPNAGDACAGGACGPGLYCNAQMKCAAPLADGTTCKTGTDACASGACIQGKCGAPLESGAHCVPADVACDGGKGLACNPVSGTCKPILLAAANGMCGYNMTTGDLTFCKAGLLCNQGSCVAGALDGATCTTMPDNCVFGEHCTSSQCTAAEPLCM